MTLFFHLLADQRSGALVTAVPSQLPMKRPRKCRPLIIRLGGETTLDRRSAKRGRANRKRTCFRQQAAPHRGFGSRDPHFGLLQSSRPQRIRFLRRLALHPEESPRAERPYLGHREVVVLHVLFRELASAHVALPCPRLPVVWIESGWPSLCQLAVPRCQCRAGIPHP